MTKSKDKKIAKGAGAAGGLGIGFAACHTVCQTLITVFAILGIGLIGLPLAFLEPYIVPLLILSILSFAFSIWMCKKHDLPLRTLVKPAGIGLIVAILIVTFAFSINSSSIGYASASNNNSQEISNQQIDKCATPPGYDETEWREHLSHHPDQYAECLK